MSTEYRRGIPSVAHVEAATRLGLLWRANEGSRWTSPMLATHAQFPASVPTGLLGFSFRPIRTDGTPVDWAVLDAEVARVAQPATVTPTASIVPTTQPQGFRADLWRRMCQNFAGWDECPEGEFKLARIVCLEGEGTFRFQSGSSLSLTDSRRSGCTDADILTRWAVYQELKPLYDIVDGTQGEVAMPRDVEAEWFTAATMPVPASGHWFLCHDARGIHTRNHRYVTWRPEEVGYGVPLRNFAAVLDAVAEQRVAARQGQGVQSVATTGTLEVRPVAPEPRSFADVRPDRHGWRWWRVFGGGCLDEGNRFEVAAGAWRWLRQPRLPNSAWDSELTLELWTSRTVIPTDEQGNPVSWESVGRGSMPTTGRTETLIYVHTDGTPINAETVRAVKPAPLPRFTADELDDVDHSATTTQDSATLKRGKLPTVEAIGKYREVMAKRNGTVAEAAKASGIDCEVAQYVLERWASGLSDKESWRLLSTLYPGMYQISIPPNTLLRDAVDTLAWNALNRPTLDTSEPADTAAQRQRAEAAERKARMTALQAQLAKERAARVMEPQEEPTRFSLLEVDEAADPVRSIEAWKAQRARNVVRPIAVPAPQPTSVPRRKAFEVVDVQADGLSGTAALAVLLGRAMNGGC